MHSDLYSATYSNVPVYEFLVNGGSVMRRKHDDWVNATHILKAANFAKAKRTRILEKDVQTGKHEKVQGGYGKYQGTWIPLADAQAIARRFKVDKLLEPVLEHIQKPGDPEPPLAPKHQHAKSADRIEKAALKAARAERSRSVPLQINGAPRKRGRPRRSETMITESALNSALINGSLKQSNSADAEDTVGDSVDLTAASNIVLTAAGTIPKKRGRKPKNLEAVPTYETPMKNSLMNSELARSFVDAKSSPLNEAELEDYLVDNSIAAAVEARQGLENNSNNNNIQLQSRFNGPLMHGGRSLSQPSSPSEFMSDSALAREFSSKDEFTNKFISFLLRSDNDELDNGKIPTDLETSISHNTVNQPIDNNGNSALHWACAMGDLLAVEYLLKLGADYRCRNRWQEVPLMRSVRFNNAYRKRTFHRITDLLKDTVFETDLKNRTILHLITLASNSVQKYEAGRHYIEMLLSKMSEFYSTDRLSEFVNASDKKGNTALFYALFNGSKKAAKALLMYGAKSDIKNNKGQSTEDLLYAAFPPTPQKQFKKQFSNQSQQSPQPSASQFIQAQEEQLQMQPPVSQYLSQNVQLPRYSDLVATKVSSTASMMVEKLNDLAELYDEQLRHKQDYIYELNRSVQTTNAQLSDIEKSLMNPNDVLTPDLTSSINKLTETIGQLSNDLQEKKRSFHSLLSQIEHKRLQARIAEIENFKESATNDEKDQLNGQENNLQSAGEASKTDSKVDGESEVSSVELIVTLAKLQTKNETLKQKIVSNFDTDGKSRKLGLYRRLISGCCNVPIGEVDVLIDQILDALVK